MAGDHTNEPKRISSGRVMRFKKRSLRPAINLSNCKYEVVRKVQKTLGWKEVGDEHEWHVYWTDTSIGADRLLRLEPYQKINHFFGMLEVCRKKALARNFAAMKKLAPNEYNFMPKSFILPIELPEFLAQFNSKSVKTFILKPDSGCQGRGIALVQNEAGVNDAIRNLPTETLVAQKYLGKPMLVNDFKFDLRIYVLVLSCNPLRVFLYKEGLARFCTEKYVAPQRNNLGQACMHLTNYAVNKRNEKFAFNKDAGAGDEGSKWSLTAMLEALTKKGHDVEKLWEQISDVTCKTLISIQPLLAHNYRTCIPDVRDPFSCFELLGLDIILDHKCKPWLLEVNHSPSFTTDTPLDLQIKEALLLETLQLVHVDFQKILSFKEGEKEGALSRLYSRRRSSAKENSPAETRPKAAARKVAREVALAGTVDGDEGLEAGPESVKGVNPDPAETGEEGLEAGLKELESLLESRREHEDKTMKLYERILPSSDPALAEKYEKLQQAAETMFQEHQEVKVRRRIARVLEERRLQEQEEQERAAKPVRKTVEQLKKLLKPRGMVRKADPRLERPTFKFSQVEMGAGDTSLEETHVPIKDWLASNQPEARRLSALGESQWQPKESEASTSHRGDGNSWYKIFSKNLDRRASDHVGVRGERNFSDKGEASGPRKPGRLSLPTLNGSLNQPEGVSSCKESSFGADGCQPSLSELILGSTSKTERVPRSEGANERLEWDPRSRRKSSRKVYGRVYPVVETGEEVLSVANNVALLATGLKLNSRLPIALRRHSK